MNEARDNAASNLHLATRMALESVSDRWAPIVLGGNIMNGVYLAWSQAGALNQALSSISQRRWAEAASIIEVTLWYIVRTPSGPQLRSLAAMSRPPPFPRRLGRRIRERRSMRSTSPGAMPAWPKGR